MDKIESRGKLAPLSPPSPPPDPVFPSAHAALKFAMNFTHGSLKKTFLAKAMGTPYGSGGLAGLDGAAQAGMIKSRVALLPTPHRQLIVGKFTLPLSPCACKAPCCGGSRENNAWAHAVNELTEYVLAQGLTGTISHYRLRRALVMRFLGCRESFISIAQACGIHRTTASEYNKAVAEHFKPLERIAFYDIEGQLKHAGVVPS